MECSWIWLLLDVSGCGRELQGVVPDLQHESASHDLRGLAPLLSAALGIGPRLTVTVNPSKVSQALHLDSVIPQALDTILLHNTASAINALEAILASTLIDSIHLGIK